MKPSVTHLLATSVGLDVLPVAGPILTGIAAGLAVAVPLGAVGVLLVHEGMARGPRRAAAGAVGVATVDAVYAALAVTAGAWLSGAVAGHHVAMRVVGSVALGAIAVHGLIGMLRRPTHDDGALSVPGGPGAPARARIFTRFVAITALNPLTAGAFLAVAAGLAPRWSTAVQRSEFVVGVALASLTWQLVLVVAGGLLGARVGEATRAGVLLRQALGATGCALVAVLAVMVATGAADVSGGL